MQHVNKGRVEREWQIYRRSCYGQLGELQERELQQAFYAGAFAMANQVLTGARTAGESAGVILEEIYKESADWHRGNIARRAEGN